MKLLKCKNDLNETIWVNLSNILYIQFKTITVNTSTNNIVEVTLTNGDIVYSDSIEIITINNALKTAQLWITNS